MRFFFRGVLRKELLPIVYGWHPFGGCDGHHQGSGEEGALWKALLIFVQHLCDSDPRVEDFSLVTGRGVHDI